MLKPEQREDARRSRGVSLSRMRRRALSIWRGLGAGLVLVLFASLVVPSAASASVGPNPHVDVQITKKFDGTGHGTPSRPS